MRYECDKHRAETESVLKRQSSCTLVRQHHDSDVCRRRIARGDTERWSSTISVVLHRASGTWWEGKRTSSMISFIKLVETNPCLWNFTLKSYSRTDLTSFFLCFNLEARYKMTLVIIVFTYLIVMSNFSVSEIANLKFVSLFCNCAETTFSKNRKLSGLIL
jgi:hypothetical protein